MTMKKILMAAVAVSALTAGAASAASISAATVSGVDTTPAAATPTPYKLATETVWATPGTTTLATDAALTNTATLAIASGKLGVGSYTVTYSLAGPASYSVALSNSSLTHTAGANCLMAPTLVSGGTVGASTVTYSVSLSGTCAAASSTAANLGASEFILTQNFKVSGLGAVTLTGSASQGGVLIDNGAAAAVTLVKNVSGYAVTLAADTVATQWALATTPYLALSSTSADAVIGAYTVNSAAGVYSDMTGASGSLTSGQNLTASVSIAGDFANLIASVAGTTASESSGTTALGNNAAFTTATITGLLKGATSKAITVAVAKGGVSGTANTVSQTAKNFTATVSAVSTATTAVAGLPSVVVALQSIGLEGTTFLAPWVGGSQSTTNTILRLSNSGIATGAVTLQLAAAVRNTGTTVGGTTCTSATLPSLASIAAGAELAILAADITTCFGDFKRGDVTITVQANSAALTAKARNNNAATGIVSELSLGNVSGRLQ